MVCVPRFTLLALSLGAVLALPWCTCQRAENIEAKAKLTRPAVEDRAAVAAEDQIDVDNLTDAAVLKRVCHMNGAEVAARLGSFAFEANSDLKFGRDEGGVRAAEHTRFQQASNGDFAVQSTTGDGSELKLAYVNDIFFLKNNNGSWRMSRDPVGERNNYRNDALAVWTSFFDLYNHTFVVSKMGHASVDGRDVVKYKIAVADQSAAALAEGAKVAAAPVAVMNDAGILEDTEPPADKQKRVHDRLDQWRARAKPAGGSGELWVDAKSAVLTTVRFEGELAIGDGPAPSKLRVKIDQAITAVGKTQSVPMPKDAIDAVVRTKMPVKPREMLEQEGIVKALPRDGGPAAVNKPATEAVDVPDED